MDFYNCILLCSYFKDKYTFQMAVCCCGWEKNYILSCKLKLLNMMCTHRVDFYRCWLWGVFWVCLLLLFVLKVLPDRSHPKLTMSGGGGYLLSGITVVLEKGKSDSSNSEALKMEEPSSKRCKLQDLPC